MTTRRPRAVGVGRYIILPSLSDALMQRFPQVVRTLRQAFCDQSDGRARVEAVASLLLSESFLAAEAGEPTATVAAATTKGFLETREALCLSANVSAHVHPQTHGEFSPGRVTLVSNRTGNRSARQRLVSSPETVGQLEAKVSVDSVLRELEEANQSRKWQLLRRQQRQRRRRGRGELESRSSRRQQRQHSGTDTDGVDAGKDLLDQEHPWEELDNDGSAELRDHSAGGERSPRPPPQRSKPSTASSFESRNERDISSATIAGPRLALAASVSTLSGLLGGSPTQRGEHDHQAFSSLLPLAVSP